MAPLTVTVVVGLVLGCCLLSSSPACGWYRQTSKPHHYSVGRASGLLQGIWSSEYTRRGGVKEGTTHDLARRGDSLAQDWQHQVLGDWKTMMMCAMEITAQLKSCAALTEDPTTLICNADVQLAFGQTCEPLGN
ncbi:neuropeptide B-like [Hemiscyllium ocellatum]|uniref:neuropeptide B-like n=1 Tax=Hemiscyllium ocellatum TaxID=170820 RepID=UPI0029660D63|nr:neuropeptide B-like [Hemiscyllium ocellatum]